MPEHRDDPIYGACVLLLSGAVLFTCLTAAIVGLIIADAVDGDRLNVSLAAIMLISAAAATVQWVAHSLLAQGQQRLTSRLSRPRH